MAMQTRSPSESIGRTTRTGRFFAALKSVKGNGTKTKSPDWNIVPHLVVRIIPQAFEAR